MVDGFFFSDGIELGTVDRIILEADDRINPGKILGVKLGFDLGMEIGIAVVIVDDILVGVMEIYYLEKKLAQC